MTDALTIVKRECPKECGADGADRIKPIVMSRFSRGGKTTVAIKLFEELKKDPNFLPIFISFNNSTHFKHRPGELHDHAILRRIAVQFTENEDDFNLNVDNKTILNYIDTQSGGKGVVLIIDELNVLSTTLDPRAAELLRSEFLDKKNRYLVITTHVPMNVDSTGNTNADAGLVMGKRPASEISGSLSSHRGINVIHMPLSVDLEKLQQMSDECESLTPFEAVFFGGVPSMIYSIKGCQFDPSDKVATLVKEKGCGNITVESFIHLVLTGICQNKGLSVFDVFGTQQDVSKMQYPLCYINALLEIWFDQKCFTSLYNEITVYGRKVGTGLDWETLVQYAVMMRCVYASKCSVYDGPFGILPNAATCPIFRFISVPASCQNVDGLITYVKNKLKECKEPTLVMANSQYANFPVFDGFVWYHVPGSNNANNANNADTIMGYQCKLGRATSTWDIPDPIRKGVLIRGLPVDSSFKKDKWEYLTKTEVEEFLGYSLQPLIPANWPALQ